MEDDNSILDVVRTEVRVTPGCLSLLETRESSHTTVCSCWRLSHLFPSDALQSPSRNYLLNHLQLLHGIWPASSCPALSGTAHRPSAKPPKSVQSHPLPAQPARLHPSTDDSYHPSLPKPFDSFISLFWFQSLHHHHCPLDLLTKDLRFHERPPELCCRCRFS